MAADATDQTGDSTFETTPAQEIEPQTLDFAQWCEANGYDPVSRTYAATTADRQSS